MKHNYSYRFENVLIRPLCIEDLEKLRKWRNDSKNSKYLNKIPYITQTKQLEWFKRNEEDNNDITFAIVEIEELKRLVGSVAVYNFKEESAEVGKFLIGDEEAHGKKIGEKSLRALCDFCFLFLNLKTINLRVYANNIPAVKIYKSVGFEMVGTRKNAEKEEFIMELRKGS